MLSKVDNTIKRHCFIGVGKSAIVAHLLAETFSSCGIPSYHLNAGDAMHGGIGKYRPEDIAVWISKSGETAEIIELMKYIPVNCAITNENSTLGKMATQVYHVDDAEMFYGVPTHSILQSLTIGYTILLDIMSQHGLNEKDFQANHPGGDIGRRYGSKNNG